MEDVESESWEQYYEDLAAMAANKMDLNLCTREDLQRLPFLSGQQIMDLMEYRDRVRRIETPAELMMIPSLERQDVALLLQFVEIRPEVSRDTIPSLRTLWKYGKHEVVAAVKLPFYERKGDNGGYMGYPYKHWLRYTFSLGSRVRAGLVASQDAGEPFFAGKNAAGYDFYSFFFVARNMGRIKALAVGRYRLRMGMGLVVNNAIGLGKINTLGMLGRTSVQVTGHSSRMEANYLQGAAVTVSIGRGFELTGFASWRQIDATLNKDDGSVATILKSGYHRTEREMERRRNTAQTAAGGNLNWFSNGWHVGLTALYTSFNRQLRPNIKQAFRRWYPQGKAFWNAGIDYGYLSNRLNISGETALCDRGAVATINTVSYQLSSALTLVALQRYYAYQYTALMGESFAEGGAVNNESGVYIGGNWVPIRGLNITFYSDIAYFPWPKYQASASSHSWDNFIQTVYTRGRWNLTARYRLRMREHDNAEKTALNYRHEHRGRIAVGYEGKQWGTKTQADVSVSRFAETSKGYMLSENISFAHRWLKTNASVGYFHTDDYASRVYMYEKGLLYNFSFPSFFGQGLRCALNARADISEKLMVMAKFGLTRYFDRNTVGSGLQEIKGNTTSDLELQVRLKL